MSGEVKSKKFCKLQIMCQAYKIPSTEAIGDVRCGKEERVGGAGSTYHEEIFIS